MKAISRENHVEVVGDPITKAVYSVIPADFMPGRPHGRRAEAQAPKQDLDRARELLEEPVMPDGFELDLITSEQPDYRSSYEVLQEELRQIGITVN